MSVINQVLKQLEQRGDTTLADQTMVRAVPRSKRDITKTLLAICLVLISGVAIWQWVSARKLPEIAKGVAPGTANNAASSVPDNLKPPRQSAGETATPASGAQAGDGLEKSTAPLLRPRVESRPVTLPVGPGGAHPVDPPPDGQAEQAAAHLSAQASTGGDKTGQKPIPVVDVPGGPMPDLPLHAKPANLTGDQVDTQVADSAVPLKQISATQRADAEFRRAAGLMRLGRIPDAIEGYEAALRLDSGHESARQALLTLLLESKRNADAERVLLEGLTGKPESTALSMLLARLQVERGALQQATATLEKFLPFADTQDDYHAFLAALYQRQNRNDEAISQYQIVLQHARDNGVWLMGYGISLQAVHRDSEAKDAYQRALETGSLSPELRAFVQTKIKGL